MPKPWASSLDFQDYIISFSCEGHHEYIILKCTKAEETTNVAPLTWVLSLAHGKSVAPHRYSHYSMENGLSMDSRHFAVMEEACKKWA